MARLRKHYHLPAFTLLELLLVMGIMAILAFFVAGSLGNLVNISTNLNKKQLVKDEGDHILEVITRMARQARLEDCITDSYFTILNPDGGSSRFLFVDPNIASRSAAYGQDIETSIDQINLNDSSVKVTSFNLDCSQFNQGGWGNWLEIKFTLADTLSSQNPVSMNFESGVSFRNQ